MNVNDALLESWDRQCRIFNSVANLVTDQNKHLKPSPDSWTLDEQLSHTHQCRKWWLGQFAPALAETLDDARDPEDRPLADLGAIRRCLQSSEAAVRQAVQEGLAKGVGEQGGYDHPVMFLQHMVWHEGWHVGLMSLALRQAGLEPEEDWQEENMWGLWRREIWPR